MLDHAAVKGNPEFILYILGDVHFFSLGSNYDNLSFAPQARTHPNALSGLLALAPVAGGALTALNAKSQPRNVTDRLRTDLNDAITKVNLKGQSKEGSSAHNVLIYMILNQLSGTCPLDQRFDL